MIFFFKNADPEGKYLPTFSHKQKIKNLGQQGDYTSSGDWHLGREPDTKCMILYFSEKKNHEELV